MMSRDARNIIMKLLEIDTRRRYRASDLMREPWIKCSDLPLSIFETAGTLFRANSVEGRTSINSSMSMQSKSRSESFNKHLVKFHIKAIDHLKGLGFSSRAIEDSMRTCDPSVSGYVGTSNQIYKTYKNHINDSFKNMITE